MSKMLLEMLSMCCFYVLGLWDLISSCVNVYIPSLLRGWMLLHLVSPSMVGDHGKVARGGLLWVFVFPGVGVIGMGTLQ